MSEKFRIHKFNDVSWHLDYPDGFSEFLAGESWDTFNQAVVAFIEASERQCPMCQRGAVVDTEWGWRCTACGAYDVAVGHDEPSDAEIAAWRGNTAAKQGCW